ERIFSLYHAGQYAQDATLDMTYTYLGWRKRNGHEEAVLGLKGQMPGGKAQEGKPGARMDGFAVIDLATGLASQIDARVTFEGEAGGRFGMNSAKTSGTLRVRLQRDSGDAAGK